MRIGSAALAASLLALAACSSAGAPQPGAPGDDAGVIGDPDSGPVGDSPTTLYVEPTDGEAPLLAALQGAKSAVHVEAYMLTDTAIVDALVAAKQAGCDVKVVLEQNPYMASGTNDTAYATLHSAGVLVNWVATSFQLTHTKTIVIDPGQPTGAVWIMSLNLSKSAFTTNRDYAAVDADPSDVAEADAIILSDFANVADARASRRLLVSPEDSRTKLAALVDGAAASLDVEMEELSDGAMEQKLGDAATRGVRVRIVVPSSSVSSATTTALTWLKGRGASVKRLSSPSMHAKAIVADQARAYVGSVNLTSASLDKNREIGVITATPGAVSRLEATIDVDFAKGTAL